MKACDCRLFSCDRGLFLMNALKLCALAALVVGSVYVTELYYQKQLSDYQAQAQKQYAQALEAKAIREQYLQGKINEAAADAKSNEIQIRSHYERLISTARSVSFDVSDHRDGDSVHGLQSDGSGSQSGVSSSSGATGRISAGADKSSGYDRAKLQRLYERQLVIARDCDITAAHYNQLIDFYTKASNAD